MRPECAWTALLGATAALLGLGLALAAPARGGDLAAWERQRRLVLGAPPAGGGRDLAALYRLFGAGFALAGAALALAALRAAYCPLALPWPSRPLGALLLLAGLRRPWRAALAASRAPAFLKGEPLGEPSERGAELCAWALSALWTAAGLLNLRG